MRGGILVVDKPDGWTSHDVVAKLRRALGERRVGHGGTLDPMATGVLPVFVGRATRAAEFAAGGDKEYIATLRLGVITDTQDTTGTVLETRPVSVTDAALAGCLARFLGDIRQIPPMYSAIKQDGKRLYELARAGKEVERAPRPVTIHGLEVLSRAGDEVSLRVACSKGTYVRTLCHDIGQALGCGGAMAALRRTRAAGFTQEQAVALEQILAHPDPRALLLPVDALFSVHSALTVSRAAETRIRNGGAVDDCGAPGIVRVYSETGEFLMLGERRGGALHTIKSFFEV